MKSKLGKKSLLLHIKSLNTFRRVSAEPEIRVLSLNLRTTTSLSWAFLICDFEAPVRMSQTKKGENFCLVSFPDREGASFANL